MEEPIIAPVENTPEQPVVETEVVVSSVDVVLEQPVIEQSVVETVPSVEDIGPQTIDFDPPFRKKISRWFVFRPLWMFIMIFPLYFRMIWVQIIMFIHFWYKLILGRRSELFWKKEVRFMRHIVKWQSYSLGLIDQRPKFIED